MTNANVGVGERMVRKCEAKGQKRNIYRRLFFHCFCGLFCLSLSRCFDFCRERERYISGSILLCLFRVDFTTLQNVVSNRRIRRLEPTGTHSKGSGYVGLFSRNFFHSLFVSLFEMFGLENRPLAELRNGRGLPSTHKPTRDWIG
jgi:hypothetical protein